MVHCLVPRVLCDPDFHPHKVYICSFTAIMLRQVLQGKWRSRGSSIDFGVLAESAEADVEAAFFDLHFLIVLAAQREP